MDIRYVIGKPWVQSARRHLVRNEGMPAMHGRNWTTTACGRVLVGWTGPVNDTETVDCKRCLASEAGRAIPAALAIREAARRHA